MSNMSYHSVNGIRKFDGLLKFEVYESPVNCTQVTFRWVFTCVSVSAVAADVLMVLLYGKSCRLLVLSGSLKVLFVSREF